MMFKRISIYFIAAVLLSPSVFAQESKWKGACVRVLSFFSKKKQKPVLFNQEDPEEILDIENFHRLVRGWFFVSRRSIHGHYFTILKRIEKASGLQIAKLIERADLEERSDFFVQPLDKISPYDLEVDFIYFEKILKALSPRPETFWNRQKIRAVLLSFWSELDDSTYENIEHEQISALLRGGFEMADIETLKQADLLLTPSRWKQIQEDRQSLD